MKHKVKRVHFVGIGGSGMSGIAEVLLTLGYQVSGSDLSESAATQRLRGLGARIYRGHDPQQVEGADAVVVSTAVKVDNPEVGAARARRIPVVPRALMLAELMRLKQGIAIAGTHGKTTTTSLIASVLAEAGMDPTFVIGGRLEAAGTHARLGRGEFIVVEADESDASFLYLQPVLAVVTNIDADHMETYGHDFSRLRQAFLDFVQRLPFYGMAVLCIDDANVRAIMPLVTKPVTTYGLIGTGPDPRDRHPARERAYALHCGDPHQRRGGEVARSGTQSARRAQRPERARRAGGGAGGAVPDEAIARALAEFKGVGRRFERYGDIALPAGGKATLIDDYGHHPAEMEAALPPCAGPSRAGAWCLRSSRTATRARATASKTSCACCRAPMGCCWPKSMPPARRRS